MTRRTGTADLPLHSGRVPPWLARRMERLGRVVSEAIVLEYGRDELLRRLAHPFWFQAFGAVMGMDWHSSGITTSVVGALKRGLEPVADELGVYVCGGRGRHSRKTPAELRAVGEATGVDGEALGQTSRMVAKVDSAAVQDGYELYLHAFVVTSDGKWAVVQQGMHTDRRLARRYHWLSEGLGSFVDEPHTGIEGVAGGAIVNLTDHRAEQARRAQVELVASGPDRVVSAARAVLGRDREAVAAPSPSLQPPLPHLAMPTHHDVRANDVVMRRLHATIRAAAERGPRDFSDLLATPGLGARTVRSLALVAEVVHGVPSRFSDPARFSMAHGGKDGHPFPVPLRVYDETLRVLRDGLRRARLGDDDRMAALRRLDAEARRVERLSSSEGPSFEALLREERRRSDTFGGRAVRRTRRPG